MQIMKIQTNKVFKNCEDCPYVKKYLFFTDERAEITIAECTVDKRAVRKRTDEKSMFKILHLKCPYMEESKDDKIT